MVCLMKSKSKFKFKFPKISPIIWYTSLICAAFIVRDVRYYKHQNQMLNYIKILVDNQNDMSKIDKSIIDNMKLHLELNHNFKVD